MINRKSPGYLLGCWLVLFLCLCHTGQTFAGPVKKCPHCEVTLERGGGKYTCQSCGYEEPDSAPVHTVQMGQPVPVGCPDHPGGACGCMSGQVVSQSAPDNLEQMSEEALIAQFSGLLIVEDQMELAVMQSLKQSVKDWLLPKARGIMDYDFFVPLPEPPPPQFQPLMNPEPPPEQQETPPIITADFDTIAATAMSLGAMPAELTDNQVAWMEQIQDYYQGVICDEEVRSKLSIRVSGFLVKKGFSSITVGISALQAAYDSGSTHYFTLVVQGGDELSFYGLILQGNQFIFLIPGGWGYSMDIDQLEALTELLDSKGQKNIQVYHFEGKRQRRKRGEKR